jgi:uncharacterized phiE125 gp8 family phage protein
VSEIGWSFKLSTAPAVEPISLADAKLDRRITVNDDDSGTERRIRSARSRVETFLERGLLTQSWTYYQDSFTPSWQLPMAAPLQSVTSIKYYDVDGSQQTLSSSVYLVDTMHEPARIHLKSGQSWPGVQSGRPLAVEVIYVVGWTSAEDIPPDILDAIYLYVGDRDELRENTVMGVGYAVQELPDGAEKILWPYRRRWTAPCAYAVS